MYSSKVFLLQNIKISVNFSEQQQGRCLYIPFKNDVILNIKQ